MPMTPKVQAKNVIKRYFMKKRTISGMTAFKGAGNNRNSEERIILKRSTRIKIRP
jgi:hypothetical protein